MGSVSGDEILDWDALSSNRAPENKIFVSVRMRPLNDREITQNDVADWECIDDTTIIFKNTFQERSNFPSAYSFDRVFAPNCSTMRVYKEAAKKTALSVLSGINSTIFAYGQTSSGKTYTMSGITEYAITDIYEYIGKHQEREFELKFSALEIHNEIVTDLLSTEGTALRLLDDPEKGIVVEKLIEVNVTDSSHLNELISICKSQRKIGETALNEMSSRSHQIMRLTVESESSGYINVGNSTTLTASVNFVDLAGSERASQTLSAGTRLKEGCHINRSLLTLGTVIRKLSKGRNGHIPFRDSKITRILQNSLGGNSKTAIICTISPAHAHVEQSRNTLAFANCAKHVSTNAQVNIVISEKALVKQLQRELARLENELRNLNSHDIVAGSMSAMKEKECLIEKMDREINELTHQRDQAISRLEDYLKSEGEYPTPEMAISLQSGQLERVNSRIIQDTFLQNNDDDFLSEGTSPTMYIDKYFGPDPCRGWENNNGHEIYKNSEDDPKKTQCREFDMTKNDMVTSSVSTLERGQDPRGLSPKTSKSNSCSLPKLGHLCTNEKDGHNLSPNTSRQRSCSPPKGGHQCTNEDVHNLSPNISRSRSCSETSTNITRFVSSELENETEDPSEEEMDDKGTLFYMEPSPCSVYLTAKNSTSSIDEFIISDEDHIIKQLDDSLREVNAAIDAELMKQCADDLVGLNTYQIDPEEVENFNNPDKIDEDGPCQNESINQSTSDWSNEFERQRREIIELWSACNIPLVHRTYFFLLFKGDPSDVVYMEVEVRRLSFLKNALHGVRVIKDDQPFTWASSAKALNREKKMLSKLMLKKFSKKERETLYKKWAVNLKTKRRRLQVCRKLWTETTNMEHIKESASVVAKLVGFKEPGQVPKEMFGLSLSMKPTKGKSFKYWRHSLHYRT